jgi:hypothetical protein
VARGRSRTSLEEAEKIAADNPFIASIRIYEIVEHG